MSERRYHEQICAIAERVGIQEPRVERAGKSPHPKIYGRVGGKILKRAVPGSPSDFRSLKNLETQLRRLVREMRA